MGEYCSWTREDGLPRDPWLRVHVRAGGRVLHPCERAMQLGGRVAQWEDWLGLPLPATGRYTAEGMLAPLAVDREGDRWLYVEPNVWVLHSA